MIGTKFTLERFSLTSSMSDSLCSLAGVARIVGMLGVVGVNSVICVGLGREGISSDDNSSSVESVSFESSLGDGI